MSRIRKIIKGTKKIKNYYLVDSCFLANKFIPINNGKVIFEKEEEKDNIKNSLEWWKFIEGELKNNTARVYIPDVCIAECFKVLSKKYYQDKIFKNSTILTQAKKKLRGFITNTSKELKSQNRSIKVHDISTTRDIIISVDRFYETFQKQKINVGVIDIILIATAKYLIDFFDIPKENLHIISSDNGLVKGTRKIAELPNAYNPYKEKAIKVFKSK